jgi:biopolymer transport protein TolR
MAFSTGNSGGRSGKRSRRRQMSEINITPMVDVMLVLLVIFMVTSPMITAGVNIDLPESTAPASRTDEKPLEISVNKAGDIFIALEQVQMEQLPGKLLAINENDPNKLVFLRGDKDVPYGRFAEVMGEVSAAGFKKLSILTASK